MQFFRFFVFVFAYLLAISNYGHADAVNARKPTLVLGQVKSVEPLPVENAIFTYPQAAIMDGDGTIYIANSLGLSVEAVRGNTIQTVLGQINPDADGINRYNDLAFDDAGGLLIVDSDSSTIQRLNLATGEVKKFADGPAVDKGLFYISSLEYREGKMLVAGVPFMKVAAAANVKTGPSKAFEFDGTSWREVLDADIAAGVSVSQIREIHYAKDGGFAAIVGKYFVTVSNAGAIRRVVTGKGYGGGIVELPDGWLVGGGTNLLKVNADLSKVTPVPIKAKLANVANLFDAGAGKILLTDSDRGTVYLIQLKTGEILRQIGNIGQPNKIVSMAQFIDGGLLMMDNAAPRIMHYDLKYKNLASLAGDGIQGYASPGAAFDFSFQYPNFMAVGPQGEIYVTEANYRIVQIKDSRVTVFAGDVHAGIPKPGQNRSEARFGSLRGIGVDKVGRVWVVDRGNHSVYRIEPDRTVVKIMGTGRAGAWREGEKAVNQPLNSPYGILLRSNGSVLIADTNNSVIAEIDKDGRVQRFAGNFKSLVYQGMGSYTGDGGPAREATFNTPIQLSEDDSGNVYVIDQFNNAVRRIASDGIITTFAGGKFGVADTPARLNHPTSALPIGDNLYIADTGNNAVWSVPLN